MQWKFVGGANPFPGYAMTAVREALNHDAGQVSDWANATANQSRMPDYDETTTGQGRIVWTAMAGSPCSGDPQWNACNVPHATDQLTWVIHVRDFTGAPRGDSHWYEHPSATGTLYLLERAALHEAFHNVLDIPNHDPQSTSVTIMQAVSPRQALAGWFTQTILDCDEAAAQLEYDVKTPAGAYSNCYDHIPNHGTTGLKTALNVTSLDTTKCIGQSVTFNGQLTVGSDTTNYKTLSGNPLGSRTVTLERAPIGSSSFTSYATTTTGSTSGAYSVSATSSTAGSWQFRVRYGGQSGQGLDARYSTQTLTASWTTIGCPTFADPG